MPQLNKGGKFVFGLSKIHSDATVQFPKQAITEYDITKDETIIIFTGSKTTGGFCVTNKSLLEQSKLAHILEECKGVALGINEKGVFMPYKGRSYAWLPITPAGSLSLPDYTLKFLNLNIGMKLVCIRSSDIAFTMGAHGPLLEKVASYNGEIDLY